MIINKKLFRLTVAVSTLLSGAVSYASETSYCTDQSVVSTFLAKTNESAGKAKAVEKLTLNERLSNSHLYTSDTLSGIAELFKTSEKVSVSGGGQFSPSRIYREQIYRALESIDNSCDKNLQYGAYSLKIMDLVADSVLSLANEVSSMKNINAKKIQSAVASAEALKKQCSFETERFLLASGGKMGSSTSLLSSEERADLIDISIEMELLRNNRLVLGDTVKKAKASSLTKVAQASAEPKAEQTSCEIIKTATERALTVINHAEEKFESIQDELRSTIGPAYLTQLEITQKEVGLGPSTK